MKNEEDNEPRQLNIPNTATIDWLVAIYFEEIVAFFGRGIKRHSKWVYRFLMFCLCLLLIEGAAIVLYSLGQIAYNEYKSYKVYNSISRREDYDR